MRQKPKIIRVNVHSPDGSITNEARNMDDLHTAKVKRHHALPHDLARRAKAVWKRTVEVSHVSSQTAFLDGFCYDTHPDREISMWEQIAQVYEMAMEARTGGDATTLQERKQLLGAAIGITINAVDMEGSQGIPDAVTVEIRGYFEAIRKRGNAQIVRKMADDVEAGDLNPAEIAAIREKALEGHEGAPPEEMVRMLDMLDQAVAAAGDNHVSVAAALRRVAEQMEAEDGK